MYVASSELFVIGFLYDLAAAAKGVNLALHRVHVIDRVEVEIFAPDERRELVEDGLAGRDIAGAGAPLDQHRAFPVLPHAFIVIERGRGRDGDTSRSGIGPQT